MTYELTDELFHRADVRAGDPVPYGCWYRPGDTVGPKHDSVAAAILDHWSLDTQQDETSGDAQYGNGWHALFRSERAILHTDNSGHVTAWRIEDGKNVGQVWAEIEAGAVTEESMCPDGCWYRPGDTVGQVWAEIEAGAVTEESMCHGHYDTDDALTSGAGIGEPTYCDGSCVEA